MYTLLVIIMVIAALLMIGIVLIQESKGGGLASQFSGYNQIGGVRKTTDFIEKATWGLAIFMVVVSVACAYFAPKAAGDTNLIDQVEANPITSPSNTNAIEATPAQEAPAEITPEAAPAENQ